METSSTLTYKEHIETLKDDLDFEEQGDAIYLYHQDDEAKGLLSELVSQAQKLHLVIKVHYIEEFERWIKSEKLHPLQMIVLRKQITLLKESNVWDKTKSDESHLQS
ncbi:MAG: hypothetical protein ACXWB0_07955 [Sulfuricurvum sp.]